MVDAGWALVGVVVIIVAAVFAPFVVLVGRRRATSGSAADEALAENRLAPTRAARSRLSSPAARRKARL